MEKSEWYTNRTWNGDIDSKFEKYFRHTRDPANKAAFLQIQGALLLNNVQQNVQNVGVALLTRAIEDFPAEHTSVMLSQEKLGDYYLAQGSFIQAEKCFRMVTNYCKAQNSSRGSSGLADLKLAETILYLNAPNKLTEAYDLVINFPEASLKLMDEKFYFTSLAAQVCDVCNKHTEAKQYAQDAIALPRVIKPTFNNKKFFTSNKTQGRVLRSLQQISEN